MLNKLRMLQQNPKKKEKPAHLIVTGGHNPSQNCDPLSQSLATLTIVNRVFDKMSAQPTCNYQSVTNRNFLSNFPSQL